VHKANIAIISVVAVIYIVSTQGFEPASKSPQTTTRMQSTTLHILQQYTHQALAANTKYRSDKSRNEVASVKTATMPQVERQDGT